MYMSLAVLFLLFFLLSLSLSLPEDYSLLTGLNRVRGITVARESNRTFTAAGFLSVACA